MDRRSSQNLLRARMSASRRHPRICCSTSAIAGSAFRKAFRACADCAVRSPLRPRRNVPSAGLARATWDARRRFATCQFTLEQQSTSRPFCASEDCENTQPDSILVSCLFTEPCLWPELRHPSPFSCGKLSEQKHQFHVGGCEAQHKAFAALEDFLKLYRAARLALRSAAAVPPPRTDSISPLTTELAPPALTGPPSRQLHIYGTSSGVDAAAWLWYKIQAGVT